MARLVALKRVRYPRGPDGKEYAPGEEFETAGNYEERDTKVLVIKGEAKPAEGQYQTRAMSADPERPKTQAVNEVPVVNVTDEPTPAKRVYRRRDMTAED